MITGLKPYPLMKKSGVEWLGEVPEHWEVAPLKRIGWFSSGAGFPVSSQGRTDEEILFVKVSDMNRPGNAREIISSANTVSREVARDLRAYIFQRNTIIFPKVGGALLTNKRRMLFQESCVDNNLMGCVVTGANVDFVFRMLLWLDLGRLAKPGPVPAISEGEIREIRIALPSPSEQTAIVRCLDYVDRRILRYIHSKQKLIGLLEEEKQAVIHRAVTRGLDPDVPLKDSGIEWLGEMPKHWGVKRGKYYFREVDVRSITGEEELLSVSHITGVTPRSQKNITMFKAESYVGSKICSPGQIAVNTMWAWMAAIGVSRYQGLISPSYHTYEQLDSNRFTDEYLDLLLRTDLYKDIYTINSSGITTSRMRLYPDDFLNIRFLCPPRHEQEEILEWLHNTTADIDAAVTRANREVELLNEYRTRLIADVVTGKRDVREAASALPEVDPLADEHDPDDTLNAGAKANLDELNATLKEVRA